MHFITKIIFVCFVFSLASCARFRPAEAPKDTDFSIPTELMNQFEVKEADEKEALPTKEALTAPAQDTNIHSSKEQKKNKKKSAKTAKTKKTAKEKTTKENIWKNRWERPIPFLPGERFTLDITYFGAIAGTLEVKVLPYKFIKGRKVFHFKAWARTASVFSLFYSLNDVGESFMDTESIVSHKFTLKLDESLQQRDVMELYDHIANKVYYWSKLDHKKKGKHEDQFEIPIDDFTQDAISAFFYIRTLPLENGGIYVFPVVTNGKLRTVQVKVVRREKLPTKYGEIPAIVLLPEVILDGVLQKKGDTFIWLSDDEHRNILKIDAKIKVGSVVAYLKDLENGKPEEHTTEEK